MNWIILHINIYGYIHTLYIPPNPNPKTQTRPKQSQLVSKIKLSAGGISPAQKNESYVVCFDIIPTELSLYHSFSPSPSLSIPISPSFSFSFSISLHPSLSLPLYLISSLHLSPPLSLSLTSHLSSYPPILYLSSYPLCVLTSFQLRECDPNPKY